MRLNSIKEARTERAYALLPARSRHYDKLEITDVLISSVFVLGRTLLVVYTSKGSPNDVKTLTCPMGQQWLWLAQQGRTLQNLT